MQSGEVAPSSPREGSRVRCVTPIRRTARGSVESDNALLGLRPAPSPEAGRISGHCRWAGSFGLQIVDGFDAERAWLYVTALAIGYMLSRGLAKSGSRDYYDDTDDRRNNQI
jgi:hypothetical protein